MEAASEERLARNEAFFRQVNERMNEIADGRDSRPVEFLCECSDADCTERIPLTHADYEHARSSPTRFVLARGHSTPEIEHVVAREGDHVVVEKRGLAARIARRLNPRPAPDP